MVIVTSAKIRRDIRHHLKDKYPEHDFRFHTKMHEAEDDLRTCDVLITYGEDLTDRHINEAENLKWIMVISAGLDKMPMNAIKRKGITVTNARGIHAIQMAEYAFSMMLQTARQAKTVIENESNKKWERKITLSELHGKTLGILGAGAIGKEVARIAQAFRMTVWGLNRSGRDVEHFDRMVTNEDLDILLGNADYIVSVLPRLRETDELLAAPQFSKMKETAVFINMGRGNVINEKDLIEALRNNEFRHAVLDVFNEEPLPEDHPFWTEEKVTVTPHLSGLSPEYQPRAFEIVEHNLNVFTGGGREYVNLVDSDKGY